MAKLQVGLAQLNLTVGDIANNAKAIIDAYRKAVQGGAQLVVFSELAVTGYPPEDLLLKPAFLRASADALAQIAEEVGTAVAIVGFPESAPATGASATGASAAGSTAASNATRTSDQVSARVYNAAAVCAQGQVRSIVRKQRLPNYAVFDEQRYFTASTEAGELFEVDGALVGVSICEDLWDPNATAIASQVAAGADLLVSVNGSPYRRAKQAEREQHIADQAQAANAALVYVNQVGGQDELVFDGGSCVVDATGKLLARLPAFASTVQVVPVGIGTTVPADTVPVDRVPANDLAPFANELVTPWPEPLAEVWNALLLATHDYVTKNGFTDVVIGTSGGVDSSLVTAIAVDALGPEHVHAVALPSRFSSDHSIEDAKCLAANLGASFDLIPIEPAHQAFAQMLTLGDSETQGDSETPASGAVPTNGAVPAGDATVDTVEQNLQSRIRGVILMALSNRNQWLVLTTGNKTELSVGYSTLYGDTAGSYAVIKDCPKLLVYELCRWRNRQANGPWIPESVLTKPPSAELSPGQLDEDHLPPYELLDPLVEGYVNGDLTTDELIEQGADEYLVRRVTRLVDLAEFKRRQSPLGPRISAKSFGKDRRMPVTNRYR